VAAKPQLGAGSERLVEMDEGADFPGALGGTIKTG
jgi:hypothetical protein